MLGVHSLKITLTQHQHSIMSKYFRFPSLLTNKNVTVLLGSRLLKFWKYKNMDVYKHYTS